MELLESLQEAFQCVLEVELHFFTFPYNVFQKWLRNLISRYDVIFQGIPCKRIIFWKYKFAILVSSKFLAWATKWAILENRSTTTIIKFFCLCVSESLKTKSILTSTQGVDGIGTEVYNPTFWPWVLASLQAWHCLMNQSMSRCKVDWENFSCIKASVLSLPKCLANPPSWYYEIIVP